jgi:hypothetical protein
MRLSLSLRLNRNSGFSAAVRKEVASAMNGVSGWSDAKLIFCQRDHPRMLEKAERHS